MAKGEKVGQTMHLSALRLFSYLLSCSVFMQISGYAQECESLFISTGDHHILDQRATPLSVDTILLSLHVCVRLFQNAISLSFALSRHTYEVS